MEATTNADRIVNGVPVCIMCRKYSSVRVCWTCTEISSGNHPLVQNIIEENRRLKTVLQEHGILFESLLK